MDPSPSLPAAPHPSTEPVEPTAMRMPPRPPHVIVLFGATGDLSKRKLLPGLLRLSQVGLLPQVRIIGTSLEEIDDAGFVAVARKACGEHVRQTISLDDWELFSSQLRYVSSAAGPEGLKAAVAAAEEELGGEPRRLHYLSIPPNAAKAVVQTLGEAGLAERARIIMEKPFGTDLESAKSLNAVVQEVFDERQVFRIDHFLGKEAAQNILAFRFANGLFEPIWNRQHIAHIQIDVPETLEVGARAAFYETAGAFRDMVVTHLFQILAFVAMEPPTALEPRAINEEKNKVFRSMMLPIDVNNVVRGQYEGYKNYKGVADDSDTETFVALQVRDRQLALGRRSLLPANRQGDGRGRPHRVDRVPRAAQEHVPRRVRRGQQGPRPPDLRPGRLLQDVTRSFYGKRPGPGMVLDKLSLQFALKETADEVNVLEAYERLILDTMMGDQTLFTSAEGIERLWEVSQPLIENPPPVHEYKPGTWGPEAMNDLTVPHGWRLPFARAWRERAGDRA
jgi:glucose-6-phosphate 1-dehydrogenase